MTHEYTDYEIALEGKIKSLRGENARLVACVDAVRSDLANYHASDDDRIAIAMSRIDECKRGILSNTPSSDTP